jgi:hypothetical protein
MAVTSPISAAPTTTSLGLHVVGNQLLNGANQSIQLLGVNRPGTEYACAEGWGVFDGPTNDAAIKSMVKWGIDAVRLPLNEDCWLGINVSPTYSGATYQTQIESYVARLNAAGMDVILDLHWSGPGTTPALQQEAMPDEDHSPAFWASVGQAFRADPNVAFELYNEPHSVSWDCWLNGCTMPGGWQAAGMQQLLDAVRGSGARQPVLVDGLQYANDLSGFLSHPLADPDNQIVAAFHVYSFNQCSTVSCWNKTVAPVANRYPVIATEVGQTTCSGTFVNKFVDWAKLHGVSALAWAWTTNEGCESLLKNYEGSPTKYGSTLRAHFRRIERSPRFSHAIRS